MLSILSSRWQQGHRTISFPKGEPALPDRFRGLPVVDPSKCPVGCRDCAEACPTDAIAIDDKGLRLDLGRCLFCTDCVEACPEQAIRYTKDFRLAARTREDLVLKGEGLKLATALDEKSRSAPAGATAARPM
jgi:formate hydrogenlyase subunit 6/NADH:ubiquinone oxidoreductase subunit I